MPLLVKVVLVCFINSNDPLLMHFLQDLNELLLFLDGHVQKLEGIVQQFAFDVRVQGRVAVERGRVVHL